MLYQLKFGFFCLAAVLTCGKAARDATLEEEAVGKDVAEAVLRKLTLSNLFPEDHSFLLRLAYTETRFGERNNTFRPDYHGGIWAVDESVFNRTKSSSLTSQLAQKFQINWTNTEWKDLRKPMHSGIAVAIYFGFETGVAIPQKIEDQAQHWRQHYSGNASATQFIEDAEKLQNETVCRGKFDLCIVLDSSNSIIDLDYTRAKNFIANMIESFSRVFTRVGMLVYSDRTEVIFKVKNTNTTKQLAEMARNATHHHGWTHTDKGILEAITLLKEVNDANGIPKIITVFTDGESNGGPLAGPVESMKNNSIKPLSIGIGSGINPQELLLIALNDAASVFMIQDFSALQSFLQKLTSTTCEIPQAPQLNQTYDDSLIANEKRIYKIQPPKEGITITVEVNEGITKGFWSYSIPVPTEALNDGIIDGPTYIPAPSGIVGKNRQTEGNEGDEEEPLTSIYITIQGVEPTNNYALVMTDGDQAPLPETEEPSTESEAPSTGSEAPSTESEAPSTEFEAPSTESEEPSTPSDKSGAPIVSLATIIVASAAILHILC